MSHDIPRGIGDGVAGVGVGRGAGAVGRADTLRSAETVVTVDGPVDRRIRRVRPRRLDQLAEWVARDAPIRRKPLGFMFLTAFSELPWLTDERRKNAVEADAGENRGGRRKDAD